MIQVLAKHGKGRKTQYLIGEGKQVGMRFLPERRKVAGGKNVLRVEKGEGGL